MTDFGIVTIPTHYTLQPAELGVWAEAHGFESLWFGEHWVQINKRIESFIEAKKILEK